MQECVLLRSITGNIEGNFTIFVRGDLRTEFVLESGIRCQITQETSENVAIDVDVGKKNFNDGLEVLQLGVGSYFLPFLTLPIL